MRYNITATFHKSACRSVQTLS